MKTIGELWEENDAEVGLRVRWQDWGQKLSYFEIQGLNTQKNEIYGILNNGESISYPITSKNWKIYVIGDELSARAV